jgi:hypothetical protein
MAYSKAMSSLWEQQHQDIQEIAEVLAREQGKEMRDVWEEALTLYRVRFETEVLPDPREGHK